MRLPSTASKAALSALTITALIGLTACSTDADPESETTADSASDSEATAANAEGSAEHDHDHDHEHDHDHDHDHDGEAAEVSALIPRVLYSTDDGLTTLNAVTGETLATEEERGFFRLNPSGDPRYAMVTAGDEFRVFDTGNEAVEHGDHFHYYESDPAATEVTYPAEKAGHVVVHDGLTALFSDGTGEVTIVDSAEIADPDAERRTFDTGEPHHGVAVPFADGSLVHTVGNEDERFTIRHTADNGDVLAETTDCPGIHGETVASGGAIFFGCTDGPVVFADGEFNKISADGYQRNGNVAGSEESPVVLADNKLEEDAEFERPTSVVLADTENLSLTTVELDSSYWFRSLGRGPGGEALVLTYDGNLVVIDENTGDIIDRIEVIEPWEENTEWQLPGPILKVSGTDAYITDAANEELVVVDLNSGEVALRHELDGAPTELHVATGR